MHWENYHQIKGSLFICTFMSTTLLFINSGRVIEQRWIFGAYVPATREGFLVFVPNRRAVTLLPLIRHHIAPGSIILSGTMYLCLHGQSNQRKGYCMIFLEQIKPTSFVHAPQDEWRAYRR